MEKPWLAVMKIIGELPLEQRQDFHLWYRVFNEVKDISNMNATILKARFDEDSYINITNVEIEDNPLFTGTNLKITMSFGCKLYGDLGKLAGSIESAELTGRIYIWDGEDN